MVSSFSACQFKCTSGNGHKPLDIIPLIQIKRPPDGSSCCIWIGRKKASDKQSRVFCLGGFVKILPAGFCFFTYTDKPSSYFTTNCLVCDHAHDHQIWLSSKFSSWKIISFFVTSLICRRSWKWDAIFVWLCANTVECGLFPEKVKG